MTDGRRLIVNADDFGLTRGVNRAIADGFRLGTVSSASLLAAADAAGDAAEVARATGLAVGLHLNLTTGRPLSAAEEIPSLVDRDGRFWSRRAFTLRSMSGRVRAADVRRELRRQLDRLERLGVVVGHIDSHQHVHVVPTVFRVVVAEATARGLPVRYPWERTVVGAAAMRSPARVARKALLALFCASNRLVARRAGVRTPRSFLTIFSLVPLPPALTLAHYRVLLERLPPGVSELMVHVADVDPEYRALQPRIARVCEQETAIVLSPEFRGLLADLQVELASYAAVAAGGGTMRRVPEPRRH